MKPQITVINGSLGGENGNTGVLLRQLSSQLTSRASLRSLHLVEATPASSFAEVIEQSAGFIFGTGTYWDSWGSPLQKFLEEATEFEATQFWLGKPAAVIVTMHSVGGKEVLSRLQGVLSTLGLLLPPMSGLVYSLATHLALQTKQDAFQSDFWQLSDLGIIANNLMAAIDSPKPEWKTWPVDTEDPKRPWLLE